MIAIVLALLLQFASPKTVVGNAEVYPVEADGNHNTREWIANGQRPEEPATYGMVKVLALRRGQVCLSAWFDPRPTTTVAVTCWILPIGSADGFVCQSASTYWESPIPVPTC